MLRIVSAIAFRFCVRPAGKAEWKATEASTTEQISAIEYNIAHHPMGQSEIARKTQKSDLTCLNNNHDYMIWAALTYA